MKTFEELKTDVLRYFDVASEPDGSADVDLVKQAINDANAARSTEDNWKFMLSGQYTLNVVAGTQEYILPHANFQKLHFLYSSTYKQFARSYPMANVPYNDVAFDQDVQAPNKFYNVEGFYPVKAQPDSATTLTLSSDDVDDAGAEIYLEGEDGSGEFISEDLAVGDTTSQSFAKVTYVAKKQAFEGTLTLATSGAVTLLTLSSNEVGKQYPVIRFTNIPVENETFKYRFFKRPRVMRLDNDIPDVPFPVCNVLIYDALLNLATYNELDSESVNIWRDKQQRWETVLYMMKMEGNTVAGDNLSINLSGAL